jgi:DNA-binding PadR family transcriptional regulator
MTTPLLGYALLGLLASGPRSGYDLRKLFVSTPLRHFSDSPGSVYPALRRLAATRYIRIARERGGNPRGRQCYAVTPAGATALRQWLASPVTDAEIDRPNAFVLRFSFLEPVIARSNTVALVRSFETKTRAYADRLRDVHGAMNAAVPLPARLALQNGIRAYESHADWAADALRLLNHEEPT